MKSRALRLSSCWISLALACGSAHGGLANLWSFDTTPLPGGGINGGYLEGTATVANTVTPLIGSSYFGNNGGYLLTNTNAPDSTKGWSFATWFRTDSDTGSTDALASWRPIDVGGFPVHTLRNQSGSLAFDVGTTSYRWQTGTSLANGQWHHVMLVSLTGGPPFTLYVDGIRRTNAANTTATAGADFDFNVRLGSGHRRESSTVHDWDGWMDDAGLFDEAVAADLAALIHGLGRLGIGLEDFPAAKALLSSSAGTVATLGPVKWERVTSGLAGVVGSSSGTIAAGTASIVTANGGSGIRIATSPASLADVETAPATLDAAIGFGQAMGVIATVSNRSATLPLRWEIAGAPGEMPALDALSRQFDANRDLVFAEIPSRSAVVPTISGDQVENGSYSNYGNQHRFKDVAGVSEKSLPLVEGEPRTESLVRNSVTTTVRYTTRRAEGFMAVSADCLNASQLSVSGSFTSDSNIASRSSSTLTVHGIEWQAWFYRISNLPDPAVHHVFLAPANAGITSNSVGSSTENFSLRNLPASCRIHHLWFQRDFTHFNDATMLAVARRFLQTTHAPAGWIQPGPARSGITASGATSPIGVTLDAAGLPAGTYSGRFAVIPAGTDVSTLAPEDFQTITLEVATPQFTVATPPAEIPLLPGFAQQGGKIVLTPAAGFNFGAISAVSAAPWLKAFPSENRPGELDLKIDTTGLAEGTYETTLTITVGTTRQVVTVRIRVWAPSYVQLVADPFRNRVYLLHDGSNHFVSSRVIVLNATTGAVVREIEAGRSYLMTQSLDGSRLFTMRRPANDIVPIDLHRMEAEATAPLPAEIPGLSETFGNLQPGPDGVVYFINRAYAGKLFAFNTRTGAVVQQIDAPEIATSFFDKLRTSPDGRELHTTLAVSDSYGGPFAPLVRYRIEADGRLTPLADTDRSLLVPPSWSSAYELQTTASGRWVSAADRVFVPGNFTSTMRHFPSNIRALAPDGEFVVCRDAIYNATGTRKLRDMPLPLNSSAIAVTPEGNVFYAGLSTFGLVDVGSDAGFRIEPAEGSTVSAPQTVRWVPVDGTREYRVHFSKDPAALATAVPAVGTTTVKTGKHWLATPVLLLAGETWHWRVDSLTPSGLQRGSPMNFTVAAFGNDVPKIEMDVVKGCQAQPVPLNVSFPTPPSVVTAAANQSWLKPAGSTGIAFEVDTRLVTGDSAEATITITADGNTLVVPVSLRIHACDHVDLIADRNHPRAFALVRSNTIRSASSGAVLGPHFLVEVDPATGALKKCHTAGFGDGRLILSNDSLQLGIENVPSNGNLRTGGVEILNAADFTRLGHVWAFQSYRTSVGGPQSALGAGNRLMTASSLINWSTGQLLARGSNTSRPLSVFSTDASKLFGGDINGVYQHDPSSPTLAQTASFSRRYGGDELPAISRDGQRIAYADSILDANLTEIARTPQLIRGMNADGNLVVTNDGLYHVPSLRKVTTTPNGPVEMEFCDTAGTLVYFLNHSSNGVPVYHVFPYSSLLTVDAGSLVPAAANGSVVSASQVTLAWSELPSAAAFRVFFGTDQAAVAAAGPGSPLELGTTLTPSWPTALPLVTGQSYFWKVIAESPGAASSSPVWSFRTPGFTLAETPMPLLSPLAGPWVSRTNSITAAPGADWTVATTTPWLRLRQASGTGSGEFTVEANPASFAAGIQTGFITVTVGADSATVPVTLNCFPYRILNVLADPDTPFMHVLAIRSLINSTDVENIYLIKLDAATQLPVETVDLGFVFQSFNTTARMFLHPQDDRIYVHFSAAARLVGCKRSRYRVESTLDTTPIFGTNLSGAMCAAGPGRMAVLNGGGPAIHDLASGTRLHAAASSPSFNQLLGSPAGDRIYCLNTLSFQSKPQAFRVFDDRIEAGPVAATVVGSTGVHFGISPDGETIYHKDGFYDRDLQLLGQAPRIVASNRDASLFLLTPSSGESQWFHRSGTSPVRPGIQLFGLPQIAWNPVNNRLLARVSSGTYAWIDLEARLPLGLPAIPGGEWVATGIRPWIRDTANPAILRTGILNDPATQDLQRDYSLAFKTTSAGTLRFDWRNLTNGGEIMELFVNGTPVESRAATTTWTTRTRAIPTGASVELRYYKPFSGGNGNLPVGELRNLSFTATQAAPLAIIAPAADGDRDGADDLIETALGSDPADAASRPVFGIDNATTPPVFYYERPSNAPFAYQVQLSDDLAAWETLEAPATTRAAGVRVRVAIELPPGRQRAFARVLVTPLAP